MDDIPLPQILDRLDKIEQALKLLQERQEERETRDATFGECLTLLLQNNGKLCSNQDTFYNDMMWEIEKQTKLLKSIFKHDIE